MYNEKIIEIFQNPANVGKMTKPDGVGRVGNPVCGDVMEVSIKVKDDVIIDAKFLTFGCTAAIVSTSVATTLIKGKTIEEALKVTNQDVLKQLGEMPPVKIHCSVLAEEAIAAAIADYKTKQSKKDKKIKKNLSKQENISEIENEEEPNTENQIETKFTDDLSDLYDEE